MAENKKMVEAITSRDEDFAKWYTDIVKKAELVDYSGIKGCMVIRPYGYAIWENIQADLDRRFKETGHENVYMPMFIPESLLQKEKDHVEGFAPECAWVTVGGSEKLTERLCVRPTSETLFCEHYQKIIRTYRDLPKLYKEGLKYGLTMILLFAWWEEGMDNGYPNYRPDPALGGADELKKAIKEINDMGGIVILYANGHIIDISTEYYKNEGHKYTQKNIEKIEYREFYTFSNNGTLLRNGNKTFAGCCHGVKSWRDKLLEIEERHLSLNSNGTFFDQIACCFRLCFDETHEHKGRIDEEPEYRENGRKTGNSKRIHLSESGREDESAAGNQGFHQS